MQLVAVTRLRRAFLAFHAGLCLVHLAISAAGAAHGG